MASATTAPAQPIEPEPSEDDAVVGGALAPGANGAVVTTAPAAAAPTLSPGLDPRPNRHRPQSLLVPEVRAMTQLLNATSQSSPDRPTLLRRLAEDCVELRKAGTASASHDAIKYYTAFVTTFSNAPSVDEARYYLGLELMVTGDAMKARRVFYELIKTAPSSKFVPYAYHAFGDLFFSESKSDPSKLDLAKQAYMEVMKFSTSPIAPEAVLQMVRVAKAQGDVATAVKMRALLVSKYPSSPAAARVRTMP